ncbi:hypothetical protein M5C96_13980 [Acidovorax sp. GBBC 1281]|uniref:hypothetical protein n=1 Tax=Acidovorax sp. GBBC 1281 TaxID=2940492 RepID=UPI0023496DC0|nr:hypothetical protein [Acidovorax sp. GBBC 1281]WCM95597.1 hypothetical protein M5C96_13980 [Acidovorax sp. GBBC 1281]
MLRCLFFVSVTQSVYGHQHRDLCNKAVANQNGYTANSVLNAISLGTNTDYLAAKSWAPSRDPLVLDLDGDGIEAVGIDPARPILFDHYGDGTRNATGWIKGDDGIVVLDRNGNGVIDSGRELFGDQTLKPVGSDGRAQNHANGYEALAAEDGNGDKVIDANDAVYSQLRIWKDTNQDGISQAGELHTLADLGIARIGVAGTASNVNLGNGNTQPLSGSFTRTDGTTGASGVAEVTGSLLLASNNFYREFSDDPAVTAAAGALPQMGGSGWVRDLREAMSLPGEAAQSISNCYQKKSKTGNQYAGMKGISCKKQTGTRFKALWAGRQGFEMGFDATQRM